MQHMDHSPHFLFFITLCILSYPTATTALGLKIHIQVMIYSIFRCNSYGERESFGSRYTEKLSLSNITLPLQNLIHCKNLIRLEFCQSIPSMWCSRKNRCCLLFEECRGIFHCTVQLCTNVQHVYSMCTLTDDFSSLKLSRQFYGWGGDDGRWSCLKLIVM